MKRLETPSRCRCNIFSTPTTRQPITLLVVLLAVSQFTDVIRVAPPALSPDEMCSLSPNTTPGWCHPVPEQHLVTWWHWGWPLLPVLWLCCWLCEHCAATLMGLCLWKWGAQGQKMSKRWHFIVCRLYGGPWCKHIWKQLNKLALILLCNCATVLIHVDYFKDEVVGWRQVNISWLRKKWASSVDQWKDVRHLSKHRIISRLALHGAWDLLSKLFSVFTNISLWLSEETDRNKESQSSVIEHILFQGCQQISVPPSWGLWGRQ